KGHGALPLVRAGISDKAGHIRALLVGCNLRPERAVSGRFRHGRADLPTFLDPSPIRRPGLGGAGGLARYDLTFRPGAGSAVNVGTSREIREPRVGQARPRSSSTHGPALKGRSVLQPEKDNEHAQHHTPAPRSVS